MKTTSFGDVRVATLLAISLVGAGSVLAGPVWAQDRSAPAREEPADCRCVDRQGNEIENCTCFRMPRMESLPALAFFSDRRARLGISLDVAGEPEAGVQGARIEDVLEGGPADEAGLQAGDIITHFDGRSLSEPVDAEAERDFDLEGSVAAQRLLVLARELEPGETVEIAYVRGGTQQTTVLEAEDLSDRWGPAFDARAPRFDARTPRFDAQELRERLRGLADQPMAWRFHRDGPRGDVRVFGPDADVRVFAPDGDLRAFVPDGDLRVRGEPGGIWSFFGAGLGAGLRLAEVNPGLGEYFGTERGVLVTEVASENTTGLEPGDVILSVDGREVESPEQLRRILASYDRDEEAELRVIRHGQEVTVTAPMR
ncbi:MAG: PDZ domain-containing protein [Longimicrobiales bacterium]|nr:PDZ domain-containing protein [Longimicrobiales bacterium]